MTGPTPSPRHAIDADDGAIIRVGVSRHRRGGRATTDVEHYARVDHHYGAFGSDLVHVVPLCGARPGRAAEADRPARLCRSCERVLSPAKILDALEGSC